MYNVVTTKNGKKKFKRKKNSVECSISYAVRLKKKKTSFILGQSLSFSLEKSMWFKKKKTKIKYLFGVYQNMTYILMSY